MCSQVRLQKSLRLLKFPGHSAFAPNFLSKRRPFRFAKKPNLTDQELPHILQFPHALIRLHAQQQSYTPLMRR